MQKIIDCSPATWSSSKDPFALSIISGSRFASFYTLDRTTYKDIRLGTEVNTVGDSVDNIWIEADGAPADSSGDWIIVQSQSNGIVVDDSVFLEPSYLDHFKPHFYQYVQHLDERAVGLEPLNMFGHDISVPDTMRLGVTLDSLGAKYGSLAAGSKSGKVLTDVEWDSIPGRAITYVADGEDPVQATDVTLHVTVPGENVKPLDVVLTVLPQPVIVTDTPPVLSPGDTVTIMLKERNTDGSLSDFSSDQQFEIGLSSGENDGNILLSDGSTGGYFSYVSQPFRFVAADTIDGDSAVVMIRVGTQPPMYSSTGKASKPNVIQGMSGAAGSMPAGRAPATTGEGSGGKETSVVSQAPDFQWSSFGVGKVVIKSGHTILLGQTKYYEALYDQNDPSKLDIKELSDPGQADADRVNAKFLVSRIKGKRLGVYWEYRDQNGNPLPYGLIRLVGRYWQQDISYEIGLTTSTGTATGSIDIEVMKPSKLGDTYNRVVDVFGNRLNLDSLIIVYAGANGIPPQLIKGQMEVESQFKPAWRYEAFQDANTPLNSSIFQDNKFVITGNGMGPNFPPPGHSTSAVAPTFYNNKGINISQYLIDNWDNYVAVGKTPDAPNIILGAENKPFFFDKTWKMKWDQIKHKVSHPRDVADNYIKSLITDQSTNLGKMFVRLAQTRIFTSYGFEQLLYTMAITDGRFYKETDGRYAPTGTQYMDKSDPSDYPEKLNEENFLMPRYSDRLLRNLNFLFPGLIPDSQWKGTLNIRNKKGQIIKTYDFDGFEANWKGSLYYYNQGSDYADEVWSDAQKFLPQP